MKYLLYDTLCCGYIFPVAGLKLEKNGLIVKRPYFHTLSAVKAKRRAECKLRNLEERYLIIREENNKENLKAVANLY